MDNIYVVVQRTYIGTEIASHQNGRVKAIPRMENDKFCSSFWMIAATVLFVAVIAAFFILEPEFFEKTNSTLSSHSLKDSGYVKYQKFIYRFFNYSIKKNFFKLWILKVRYSTKSLNQSGSKLSFSDTSLIPVLL